MRGQKELEVIFIKKLFDYKLSMSKCLLTVSWAELGVTTVDTLVMGFTGKNPNFRIRCSKDHHRVGIELRLH